MTRRIEWAVFQLSTITGCRDIRRNVKWRSNVNYKCRIVDVLTNISASSDCRKLKHSSFDLSCQDDSNELYFIFLWHFFYLSDWTEIQWSIRSILWYNSNRSDLVKFRMDDRYPNDRISEHISSSNQLEQLKLNQSKPRMNWAKTEWMCSSCFLELDLSQASQHSGHLYFIT